MLSVKECCCGCSLRTGSLILLWIGLVMESFNFIGRFFLSLVFNMITSTPSVQSSHSKGKDEEDGQTALKFLQIFIAIVFLIECIISAIFCLCGLIGIYKNIPKYLTFGVYYFGYEIVRNVVVVFLLIFVPRMGSTLVPRLGSKFNDADARAVEDVANSVSSAFVFTYVLGYLFFLESELMEVGGVSNFVHVHYKSEQLLTQAVGNNNTLQYVSLLTYFFIVVKSCRDAMRKGTVDRGTNNTLDANALVYHYKA